MQRSAGRRSARPGGQAGKTTAVAASVRTELMGVTAAAAAAAVALAVVAASINLPNLHAPLPLALSSSLSLFLCRRSSKKLHQIALHLRGNSRRLATFEVWHFHVHCLRFSRKRPNGGQLLQLINPFALWLSLEENVFMWSVKL